MRRFLSMTLVLCAASAGCGTQVADAPVVRARLGSFEKTLSVRGKLQAAETIVISAEAGGKLSFMIPEGTVVKEGDPLFGLETEQIEDQLLEARLDLAGADAAYEKAREEGRLAVVQNDLSLQEKRAQLDFNKLQADQAGAELEKKKRQVEAQILPKAELAAAELAVEQAELSVSHAEIDLERLQEEIASRRQTAQLDMQVAQGRVEKAQSKLSENEEYMAKAVATAPRGGIVVHTRNWRNETFRVGEEIWRNTPVMELPDLSGMEVVAEVNEVDIAQVAKGMPVRVRVEAFPDLALTGRVAEISGLAKDTKDVEGRDTGVRVFEVGVQLGEQDSRLRPGMTATVEVVLDRRENVVLVPAGAVTKVAGKDVVTATSGDKRPVVVGAMSADDAVIESGLAAGDEVLMVPAATPSKDAAADAGEPPPEVEAPPLAAPSADQGRPGRPQGGEDRGRKRREGGPPASVPAGGSGRRGMPGAPPPAASPAPRPPT